VTKAVAEDYIVGYKKQYPGINEYMTKTKGMCIETGYVETLFGRRCYIPAIHSSNRSLRNFAERAAINTPIQGTSADITKLAMIRIHDWLKKEKSKTRMLLQVHDELIFEVPDEECESTWPKIKEIMESVGADIGFSVPLTVGNSISKYWDDK
jgi:DNA polymerase-1